MKKTALIILDGWGHGETNNSNAIYRANTPFIDSLYKKFPNSELITHGEMVGLPKEQMGNSRSWTHEHRSWKNCKSRSSKNK